MTTPAAPSGPPHELAARAEAAAGAAAAASAVRVLPLDTTAGAREASELFRAVWRSGATSTPMTVELLRAVEHAGGYAVGAYATGPHATGPDATGPDATGALVGASSGFLGLHGGDLVLHSHITGVTVPGRGIGMALKLHQRAWALSRGIRAITWTFDPLVRRNAWFNLARLRAVGVEHLVDFYGAMSDGVNAGDSTDRLFTRWDLVTEPATRAPLTAVDRAAVVLDAGASGPSAPLTVLPDRDVLLVALPPDVEALRTDDPPAARAWRTAVRQVLVPAFAAGYRARDVTRDGHLVLDRCPTPGASRG